MPESNKYQRIFILLLSLSLIAGSFRLYLDNARPFSEIMVEKDVLKERYTMEQLKTILEEGRKVNINTATKDEMKKIPGIGETMARRILEYREKTGRFGSAEDLMKVTGIGPGKLKKMRKFIRTDR